jgi:hypothetical protein
MTYEGLLYEGLIRGHQLMPRGLLPWGVAPSASGHLREDRLRYGRGWGGSH